MSSFAKRFDNIRSILINDLSIQHLFSVQSQVIPYLIQQNQSHSPIPLADICVSSPTGSEKTLTYVIPLLQYLAEEVYNVVNQIGNKLQLKTALLAAQHLFKDEQKILVKQQLNGTDRIIDKFKRDWLNVLDTVIGLSSHLKNDFQPYILSQSSSNHKIYQKLFFSATLTHNPEILQQLNLFRLVLSFLPLSTSTSITMLSTLLENFIVY
ncbi:unnamed protein product [Rotaria sordida]|uniref:ATP-dependent RNA helicase n=1 Tax=Rotaria sordida TaxID=392033 RepID=A0A819ND14_9BILA|nr:unnamed protein product [Rotaria sordida]